MSRWIPKKQGLASQLPEGSEDVAFKNFLGGPIIVKAHAAVLANQSKELHDMFYPLREGQTFPITVSDWIQATNSEEALKAFVKILYGTGPSFASLDFKVLLEVISLAAHYVIPELTRALMESKRNSRVQVPVQDIPYCLTFAHHKQETSTLRPFVISLVRQALKNVPGRVRVMKTPLELNFLKGQLTRMLPACTDIAALLDAYKKFLVLKVVCNDIRTPQEFSPSALVDQVWHAHMMHPRLYRAACSALFGPKGGDLIDHDPAAAEDEPSEKYERLRRTKVVYKILFGHEAPPEIWAWSSEPGEVLVFLKQMTGKTSRVHVDLIESVAHLKCRVQDKEGIPPDQQRIIFAGRQLEDHRALVEYNIKEGSNLHLVIRLRGC